MGSLPSFINPVWERDVNGNSFFDLSSFDEWTESTSNNVISQNHPILTPAILFVSKLFSQANFYVENSRTEKQIKSHWLIDLLNKPNGYQTKLDFLETLMFSMIANGMAVVLKKKIIGFDKPQALYILNPDDIEWPGDFKKEFKAYSDPRKVFKGQKIKYKEDGTNQYFKIEDLLFFYDLPNFLNKNPFKVKSRLDGLKQTLINTKDSLIAKNIILKSNGKELISLQKDSMALSPDEKTEAEQLLNVNYGLSRTRKRGLITKASLDWKSLHIALRDLGLDESIKVDGNLIYTALHIPKDILSLEAKKTTYNNFKESMVSYVQNEMYPSLRAILNVFDQEINEPNLSIKGDYDHLPIMEHILKERYEAVSLRAIALSNLRKSGIPDEMALQLCGLPTDTVLGELLKLENNGQQNTGSETNEGGDEES